MPIERVAAPTKSEIAYTALRDAIRTGELAPGERLLLQDLAGRLGMSLTPVRDALRLLAAHGLIEHRANYGAVVSQCTPERAEEIYRLRMLLEPMATELAAERASAEQLAAMGRALDVLDEAVGQGRENEVTVLNARFHHEIYTAADSDYLIEFVDRLWNGVPYQAISLAGRVHDSAAQHRAIMAALRERDGAAAAGLMRAHIAEAAEHTLRQLTDTDRGSR
ncbi:DNA-binding GntR family transcriptional regulator [Spinactinospora alkalitolerans]|uniref:DNA-binding GntR family transcriptional regulator n=1 Tax=Spinactinospora alkalitolerans TaxID=687207 RepID=A0A852TW44_9ACTN|nr:GntR family transcriptional regulator [Spinactinospora alkalitolerans]NYE48219.1 DNA-binding GntR family transcriptional regulator [Spinactinospora alkalitolerans]